MTLRGRVDIAPKVATVALTIALVALSCTNSADVTVTAAEPETSQQVAVDEPVVPPTPIPPTAVPPTPESPTPSPLPESVQLRADGIGPVALGDPAAAVVAELSAIYGEPTGDEIFGETLDGVPQRFVTWDVLTLLFSETPLFRDDGVEHLIGWYLTGDMAPPLATTEGFRVGSTLAELRGVYPELVPGVSCSRWQAVIGEVSYVNGVDSAVIGEFGDIPVPDPRSTPPPPGFEDAVVTVLATTKGTVFC